MQRIMMIRNEGHAVQILLLPQKSLLVCQREVAQAPVCLFPGTHIGKVLVQPIPGTDEVAASSELKAVPQISFR